MSDSANSDPAPKAEETLRQAREHHQAGRLAEAEALYRDALRGDPDNAAVLSRLGAALAGQGRLDDAAAVLTSALDIDPGLVDAHNNLGLVSMMAGRADDAARAFAAALDLDADNVSALSGLGAAMLTADRGAEATAAFRRVLEIEPDHAEVLSNLGTAERRTGNLDAALDAFDRAIAVRPDLVAAHVNRGNVLRALGRLDAAADALRRALRLDPGYPEAHWNLSHVLLAQGNFEDGWAAYEWRAKCEEFRDRTARFSVPAWDGSDLGGKTILAHAEQGFGDNIQFIRFVPSLAERGGRVVVHCPSPLTRLFRSLAGGADIVDTIDDSRPFDVHIPLPSLAHLLGIGLASLPGPVPYLAADGPPPALGDGAGLKVGIVWSGNPDKKISADTSVSLARFQPLLDVDGCRVVSLQVGDARDEIAALGLTDRLDDLGRALGDFADTAAVMAALDLVITIDTAAAHLAGALGRPVWTLLSHVADWRWMTDRPDSPWYPSMRLFRQPAPGDWDAVFADVEAALAELAG